MSYEFIMSDEWRLTDKNSVLLGSLLGISHRHGSMLRYVKDYRVDPWCGNFDMIWGGTFEPSLPHSSALCHPPRAAQDALVLCCHGDHAHRILIEACNPMWCPIHVFWLGLDPHYVTSSSFFFFFFF